MLPFARLVSYGNTTWYKGTELIAWDSTKFNVNGFTDYTGKTISVGLGVASTAGTLLPSKSTQTFKYGSMVYLGHGSHIGTINNVISNNVMSADWCIDFWLKNDGTSYGVFPLISLPNVAVHDSTMLYTTETNGILRLAVNGTQINAASKWSALFDGGVHHFGIQYISSTGEWRFYVDGIFMEAITLSIPLTLARKDICICSTSNTSNAYIERYRLRAGQWFTGSSFNLNTIYN